MAFSVLTVYFSKINFKVAPHGGHEVHFKTLGNCTSLYRSHFVEYREVKTTQTALIMTVTSFMSHMSIFII